jgi:hypothetical protein
MFIELCHGSRAKSSTGRQKTARRIRSPAIGKTVILLHNQGLEG